jgi:hypothetical protein
MSHSRDIRRATGESTSRKVMGMTIAQIGPLTTALEAVAASVGAGIVLGGVAIGAFRLTRGWARERIERRALTDGYLGGIVGAVAAVIDIVLRYGR